MVLSFALCATFAFAQTNNSVSRHSETTAAMKTRYEACTAQNSGYKGSIFTKAEGDTILHVTFNAAPTTGTLTAADQVDTTVQAGTLEHTQSGFASTWRRHTDTSNSYWSNQANYPAWNHFFGINSGRDLSFRSPSVGDGFMVMDMVESITQIGGAGTVGGYNAYMSFGPMNCSNVALIDIRFYQRYQKFNRDRCWIDYSTDGSTWHAVEINITNLDIAVNDNTTGWVRATLPASAARQANVYFRIRWSCPSDGNGGGAYGYYWIVDDVMAIEGPANRITSIQDEYFEGFYGMMPQGLSVPMVWNVDIRNTGGNTQTNIVGELKTSTSRNSGYTSAGTVNIASLPSMVDTSIRFDPKGWYGGNGFGYNTNTPSYNPRRGPTALLPTATTGMNYVFGDIRSTAHPHILATATNANRTYDTIGYTVNAATGSAPAVWAHDNGVLRKFSIWVAGMALDNPQAWSSELNNVGYNLTNYGIYNSYLTGDNIPAGWRIKGMQLVAATYPGYGDQAGMEIFTMLRKDSVYTDGGRTYVSFGGIETGANNYLVQPSDLNTITEYEEYGDYHVITIDFPNQPALEPNTAYRVGYHLAEDGEFAVAANTIGYYDTDTNYHYFRNVPGMEGYGSSVGHPNVYNTLVYDPTDQDYHFFKMGTFPMIRMLVGPYEYRTKHPVDIQCGAHGNISDQQYNMLCGQIDSVVDGASRTYIFIPDEDYMVDQIFQDGAVIFTNDTTYLSDVSYTFTIDAPTTINVTFTLAPEIEEGIDPVASNVNVNLQPNPATSNVQLTISGVEGMVDFSLVDMSGRIIRSAKMDATTAQNISLAGLAKGAYFVRITNSNFSKVEKLIVR